ncbi:uncharacterized protein N7500_009254 [Penicillium coprophilum]|uniref:uncharacterized protein n=1 Tax=Penicillium coprophilum TaxID=36646 RepID=UPI00239373DC|nr:uncharacterized protein N7500_009254 [Penicillium coprophilum]KAJ5153815.1 hypothetical protein N7500_009254 [Penicillium coprophilum]
MWLPEMSEMISEYQWEWQKLYLPWILNEEADTVAAGASFPFVRASPVWWAKFGWWSHVVRFLNGGKWTW